MVTFALIGWDCCYITTLENSIMELREDTLVDLKFIMADTGFGKTYIYDRVKDGTLCKPIKISGRSRWKYRDHLEFKNKLISGCGG